MAEKHLSESFLQELGLTSFSLRPELRPQRQSETFVVSDETVMQAGQIDREMDYGMDLEFDQQAPVESLVCDLILIGDGLSEIWQNDTAPAWRLWQAILTAFNWQSLQVKAYDAEAYSDEETCFPVLEAVMDSGVERVFSLGQPSLLAEMLADGLEVVSLPDLNEMLSSPQAKKHCFLTLSQI